MARILLPKRTRTWLLWRYVMPISITRCSNNYGPYPFLEKLISLRINNDKNHKQFSIYDDGVPIRDWMYVAGHCKAIDMVANNSKIGEVYNVGGHKNYYCTGS